MNGLLVAQFAKRFHGGPTIEGRLECPIEGFSCTVLFGSSGCGKTTFLRCLAGLERPETGTIRFGEETWLDADRGICRRPQERRVGFVFQDYALFPHLTVAENIRYGMRGLSSSERNQRAAGVLARLGLTGLENRFPRQISGGQQQRIALGRSLAVRPRLLLLDEPLAALDESLRAQVRRELRGTLESFAVPTIAVTHDRLEALALADQLVLMHEGRVIQTGPVADVFAAPQTAAAARVLGVETIQPAEVLGASGDFVRIRIEHRELLAAAVAGAPSNVFACIRAEEVEIGGNQPGDDGDSRDGSEGNRLTARVVALTDEGPIIRFTLDCGFPLNACVSRSQPRVKELSAGQDVPIRIPPRTIRLVPRN